VCEKQQPGEEREREASLSLHKTLKLLFCLSSLLRL